MIDIIISLTDSIIPILGVLTLSLLSFLSDLSSLSSNLFEVGQCNRSSCPGSFYLPITAAWANIGYMTHADFVHFVWNTSFGMWAAIFYFAGAVGALISVSINQPPRTYMWFFLGPPIYSFLVGTTTNVQGVSWRIANKSMEMEEVWRDAETGMANTELATSLGLQTSRKEAPSGTYGVAWPMVFLDGLFSEATNNLVSWIGMQRREGRGDANSNLFNKTTEIGPWSILANLKWGMVENIVGANVKDPDVRDAFATFLTSECGDWFKKGVNSGAYSASSQSRGANLPRTVFIDGEAATTGEDDNPRPGSYTKFKHGLDTESIPTPRSMVRLLNGPSLTGSFRQFSNKLSGNQAIDNGRLNEIVCSEYLYVTLQAFRWEAGHAYWQLIRSFPKGFKDEAEALETLFYGWNLRENPNASMLSGEQLKKYTKFLILSHILRNELILAPQVNEFVQRFTPSEQMRGYTEASVRQGGSRAKYGELYQWAVMMPHVQGILAYLILIGYPFAAMLMVVPGYWKAFFTWVTFFAWVKLWDVGFAIVHTLERSVWAMIGNHSAMARVGRRLINTSQNGNGDIEVSCGGGGGAGGAEGGAEAADRLSFKCSVPQVREQGNLTEDNAWFILDQILTVAGSLDLDLSNGYYIYIMAALYFAVPAVTGQLVLGAKASLGGLATQAIGQNAQEAGGAAKAGTQAENSQKVGNIHSAIDQTGKMKSFRQSGFALQSLGQQNAAMEADIRGSEIGAMTKYADGIGTARGLSADHFDASKSVFSTFLGGDTGVNSAVRGALQPREPEKKLTPLRPNSSTTTKLGGSGESTGLSGGGTGGVPFAQGISNWLQKLKEDPRDAFKDLGNLLVTDPAKYVARGAIYAGNSGMALRSAELKQDATAAKAMSAALGNDLGMDKAGLDLAKSGHQAYGRSLGELANFNAMDDSWYDKAAYSNNAGALSIYTGGSVPGAGQKGSDMMGLAMSGNLGKDIGDAAKFSGNGFFRGAADATKRNKQNYGSNKIFNAQNWQPNDLFFDVGQGYGAVGRFAAESATNVSAFGQAAVSFSEGNFSQGFQQFSDAITGSKVGSSLAAGAESQYNRLPQEKRQMLDDAVGEVYNTGEEFVTDKYNNVKNFLSPVEPDKK
jgi:hypothetical protein